MIEAAISPGRGSGSAPHSPETDGPAPERLAAQKPADEARGQSADLASSRAGKEALRTLRRNARVLRRKVRTLQRLLISNMQILVREILQKNQRQLSEIESDEDVLAVVAELIVDRAHPAEPTAGNVRIHRDQTSQRGRRPTAGPRGKLKSRDAMRAPR